MDQDILSEVFSTLRISSDLYFRASLGGDFAVEVPKERRKIRFHLVREGTCWLTVPGMEPVLLNKGDIAIVPDGAAQVLSADAKHSAKPLAEVIAGGALLQGLLCYGAGEAKVNLLCGYCSFDEAMDHPVLTGLPPLILLRPDELVSEPWAKTTLQLLAMEVDLDAPGMMGILSRLLEIIFIQAVRRDRKSVV